ncbi:acyl-homoserine-lactone synthase [uncultured Roseovarius sp.]|uniref:acyl-homoserine-lactone synthase n=1 Tax=uncultured Roseovarius sp. TaxID=293344 RepID=UPI00261BB159|nr:acyl-homoserine-lactone synthase [uncultured Roseovarius sp.]
MILVIDALNKHKFPKLLDEMFLLRGRVFGGRLGWDVSVDKGRERDHFDDLDPAYVIGLDDEGHVVSCVRALQTTGPHMLSDVFSEILDGEPPIRSATIWESTRFCVDTKRLGRGKGPNSLSYATCELMLGSLEYAQQSGITDIITVIDPVMDRVLKRSDNAPYDYVGKVADMGKVPALAALLDCTDERMDRIRAHGGIEGEVFISDEQALALPAIAARTKPKSDLEKYCEEQISAATTKQEKLAALRLKEVLEDKIRSRMDQRA